MANILEQKTVRKGTKSRLYVIEKIGNAYCVGMYRFGGLTAGWKLFKRLPGARKYFTKLVSIAKGGKDFPTEVK